MEDIIPGDFVTAICLGDLKVIQGVVVGLSRDTTYSVQITDGSVFDCYSAKVVPDENLFGETRGRVTQVRASLHRDVLHLHLLGEDTTACGASLSSALQALRRTFAGEKSGSRCPACIRALRTRLM